MDGKIQDYCKLGIIHFMLYKFAGSGEGDILNTMRVICDDEELDAIEVTHVKDKAQRAEVAALLKESGKTVGFGAHPIIIGGGLDLNHENNETRQTAVDTVKALIEQAYEFNSAGFVVLSGKDTTEEKRPQARKLLVESLLEIDRELKYQGDMPLILEVFDRVDFGKNCLIGPHQDSAELAVEVRKSAPDFGILADLSHIPILYETPRNAIEAVKECLVHAHIGNCIINDSDHPMYGDMHPPLCDPAGVNGVDEVADFLKVLMDIGFLNQDKRPVVSFEVCVTEGLAPEELLRQSKDVTYEAFAKL